MLIPDDPGGDGVLAVDPGTGVPAYQYMDAGVVTITADQTITMVQTLGESYSGETPAGSSMFHAGQLVTVEIAGNHGDPPEVSLTYTAPGPLEITQPTGSAFIFDRTQDASFTWTATYGDSVYLYMRVSLLTLICEWPMADQKGTVPASLLSRMPEATTTATLSAQTMHEEDHGRWRIQAGADASGSSVDVTLR